MTKIIADFTSRFWMELLQVHNIHKSGLTIRTYLHTIRTSKRHVYLYTCWCIVCRYNVVVLVADVHMYVHRHDEVPFDGPPLHETLWMAP